MTGAYRLFRYGNEASLKGVSHEPTTEQLRELQRLAGREGLNFRYRIYSIQRGQTHKGETF